MNLHNEVFLMRARKYNKDPSMYNVIKELKEQRFTNKLEELDLKRIALQ
jgi:hypothetical protein